MVCGPCLEKYRRRYRELGFSEAEADQRARRLLARVARRRRYDQVRDISSRIRGALFKWCFLTSWRATLYRSARAGRLIWIGRGFNPDYTQACTGSAGAVSCTDDACLDPPHNLCDRACLGGSCNCPAPSDPHSHQVSSACGQIYSGACSCRFSGGVYYCYSYLASCACGGTCGYSCDPGYTWSGSQCVPIGGARQGQGDGFFYTQ
jgi:hypothetical protein